MSKGRFVTQPEADAALRDVAPNPIPILQAGLADTPNGRMPLVLCGPHADLAAVITAHAEGRAQEPYFEWSYCLSVDTPAWVALRATYTTHTLAWVFSLPRDLAVLETIAREDRLAVAINRRPGALLFSEMCAELDGPLTAYNVARKLRRSMDAARNN